MDFVNTNKQLERKNILEEIKNYNRKNQITAYINVIIDLLGIFSLLMFSSIILYAVRYPLFPSIVLIYSIVVVGVFLLLLPYLGITIIIYSRTRYKQFVFELIEFFPMIIALLLIPFLVIQYHSVENLFMISITLVIFVIILDLGIIIKRQHLKKPIFWNNSFTYYISTVLTQQTYSIPEQQDGFSQRPFFRKFDEIKNIFPSSHDFMHIMEEYCTFLAKKGELIGWTITHERAMLNPRTLLSTANFILGVRSSYQLLAEIYKKHHLTSINIDYHSGEISLSINYNDYKPLSDVTYHVLAIQLLERFEQSIRAFAQQDFEEAYRILFPITKKDIKTVTTKSNTKKPILLIIPTVVEVLTGSIILIYVLFVSIILISAYTLGLLPTQVPFEFTIGFILGDGGLVMFSIGLIVLGIKLWNLSFLSVIINSILVSVMIIYLVLTILLVRMYTINPVGDLILIVVSSLVLGYFYKNRAYFRTGAKNTANLI